MLSRVYTEKSDHLSWENVVDSRRGLATLISKLKGNLMYRNEIMKRREEEEQKNSKKVKFSKVNMPIDL